MTTGKSVLITGGTGKIGAKLVNHLFSQGYDVIFTSRSLDKIDSLIKNLQSQYNNKVFGIAVDFEDVNCIEIIIDHLNRANISPDCLINNARNIDYLKIKNELGMPDNEQWLGEYLIDVVIPYELSMKLANQLKAKLTNIINISSMYGVVPANPNLYDNPQIQSPIHYSVAKAALIHLTKELAIRLSKQGIRVNAVSYGGVEGRVSEEFKERYGKLCPIGRMLKEEEVIGAIDFLVSDKAIGMTGHNLVVDGGWTVW